MAASPSVVGYGSAAAAQYTPGGGGTTGGTTGNGGGVQGTSGAGGNQGVVAGETESASSDELPFTGFNLATVLIGGLVLFAGGMALRAAERGLRRQ